jgi:septum formation protein
LAHWSVLSPDRTPALVLASASPARLRLLRDAGFDPEVVVSGVDEDGVTGGAVEQVRELAVRKAAAVAARRPEALVLGCDSLLELDGAVLGKPASAPEAVTRWQAMRGATGTLHTGHSLHWRGAEHHAVCSTTVRFGNPSDAEIEAYVASGEPLRVAGAFTLDGRGSAFLAGIDGDAGNVIGLSVPVLRDLLAAHGLAVVDLWS